MNPAAEVLHNDAGQRKRQNGIQRKPGADMPHENQRHGGENQRVRRVHNRRTKQHADSIQVIGRPGHNVAGAVLLVVRVRERFQVAEEIIAQIVLNLARDADHQPAGQELKDALAQRQRHQQQGINQDLVLGHAVLVQIVDGAANHLGREHPQTVVEENGNRAPEQGDAILLKIRPQRLQVLAHEG